MCPRGGSKRGTSARSFREVLQKHKCGKQVPRRCSRTTSGARTEERRRDRRRRPRSVRYSFCEATRRNRPTAREADKERGRADRPCHTASGRRLSYTDRDFPTRDRFSYRRSYFSVLSYQTVIAAFQQFDIFGGVARNEARINARNAYSVGIVAIRARGHYAAVRASDFFGKIVL